MYEDCNFDYYNVFMKQFIQTLAQLSAAVVTSAVAVPVYSYYKQTSFYKKPLSDEVYEFNNENDVEESENVTEREVSEEDADDEADIESTD